MLAGAAVMAGAAATGGLVAVSSAKRADATSPPTVATATVERGRLSDQISQSGTLTYRAQRDGAAFAIFNRGAGTYTQLPAVGDKVECGHVLYRLSDKPVLLLCGRTPAYRSMSQGETGPDVAELNANLVRLGLATRAQLVPSSASFGSATTAALERLQAKLGDSPTGSLPLGRVVFLPESVRIATVSGELGGLAQPGAQVLAATSDALQVQLALDPSQQGAVKIGDRAEITLPDNRLVPGRVERLGRVAQIPAGQNGAGSATVPAYLSLDHPEQARGLDQAPVEVAITTRGVADALSVPVTAIVGRPGGGFAVEVVRADGQREPIAVKLGLFDGGGGRVQVEGNLQVGERVVVPSS